MASSMIHLAVAHEINKKIKRDNAQLLIGSIAPDISKLVGENKIKSHFLNSIDDEIPDMDRFLEKYQKHLDDDFVMGYFIHLYTDYLWYKYFMTQIYNENTITKLDGSVYKVTPETYKLYMYNDYTNLNIILLDKHNMDLSIFYNEVPDLKDIIKEIPMSKINLILESAGVIIENTKVRKDFMFNIDNVEHFIKLATDIIIPEIEKLTLHESK